MRPASDAERAWLNDSFAALCRISSPTGRERELARHVTRELETLGPAVAADAHGNLLCRIPGRSQRTVLLCAHLDTAEPHGAIEPVVVDGGWQNARDTILGADAKAALAVLLALARRVAGEGAPVGLELLLTTGLQGAKAFDTTALRADFGYVLDHASPIGEVIMAAPACYRLTAEFHGRGAHAGLQPESGRSAILAAGQAIATMPHGRLDEQTTANVGSIHGGVGAGVVAERCTVEAEARSLDAERVEQVVAAMIDALHDGAAAGECDVDIVAEKQLHGYRQKSGAPAVVIAESALRACGYKPRRIVSGAGSDADALMANGLTCVNLANGTEHPHQPNERVSVAALEGMLDVCLALLDQAALA